MIQDSKISIDNDQRVCPICGDSKDTIHLHKMYTDLLAGAYESDVQGINKSQLTRMISPPALLKNDRLSSIQPDVLALILFVIIGYLFVIRLAEKGPYTLVYGLGIGVLLLTYLILRQILMAKYVKNKHARDLLISEIRAKADIWMEMIYCKKDDLVFTPDHLIQLQLDQLKEFWLSESKIMGNLL